MNICGQETTSAASFHVVEKTRTCARYAKMKSARAKRAKLMFLIVKYANL